MKVAQGNFSHLNAGIAFKQIRTTIYGVHRLPVGFIARVYSLKLLVGFSQFR
jgi:hypothetical protein